MSLSPEEIKAIIYGSNEATRQEFAARFGKEIEQFINNAAQLFRNLAELDTRVGRKDMRSAFVCSFLFFGFNCLVVSLHLLISGFSTPAGNLMRSCMEAVAMALLCSHRQIGTFDNLQGALQKKPIRFCVHKALDWLRRADNVRRLNLERKAVDRFCEVYKDLAEDSHASLWSLAHLSLLDGSCRLVAGSEFVAAKVEFYAMRIKRIAHLAEGFINITEGCGRHLQSSERL